MEKSLVKWVPGHFFPIFCNTYHNQQTIIKAEQGIFHYNDVIMSMMASQITGVSIVYLAICSGSDQRKYQNSAS